MFHAYLYNLFALRTAFAGKKIVPHFLFFMLKILKDFECVI